MFKTIKDAIAGWFGKPVLRYEKYDNKMHESVTEAINETFSAVHEIKSETRERNRWLYMVTDLSELEVVALFGLPEGTATRVGVNFRGQRMVACWYNYKRAEEPYTEPVF
jgi:hypothetical protein